MFDATYIMPCAKKNKTRDINNICDMSNTIKKLPKTKSEITSNNIIIGWLTVLQLLNTLKIFMLKYLT